MNLQETLKAAWGNRNVERAAREMNLGESTVRRALNGDPNVSGAALLICLAYLGIVPSDYKRIIRMSRKTRLRMQAHLMCAEVLAKQQNALQEVCKRREKTLQQVSGVWFVLIGVALLVIAIAVTMLAP